MPATFGKDPDVWTHKSLPPNPYKPGSQNYRLYSRLSRYKRVLNFEIQLGLGGPRILKYTNRVSECRSYLQRYGLNLTCRAIKDGGVYQYEVRT